MLRVLVTSLAFAFLTQVAAQPAQEHRVALVIGVTDYDAQTRSGLCFFWRDRTQVKEA